MTKLNNPYSKYHQTKAVSADVGHSDYYLIKAIRPEQGTIAAVVATIWKKLCYELRKRNIGDFTDKERFEDFVTNCHIVDGECPPGYTLVENGELEDLRSDSANWQIAIGRGRLPHGTSGGHLPHSSPPHEQ